MRVLVRFYAILVDRRSDTIRVGRFCPLGQNLVVLTRLKPSCPKPLGWTKLDKTGQNWTKPGQNWTKPGLNLDKTWTKPGLNLDKTWTKLGQNLD